MRNTLHARLSFVLFAVALLLAALISVPQPAQSTMGPIYVEVTKHHVSKHVKIVNGPLARRRTYYVELIQYYTKFNPTRGRTTVRLTGLRATVVHGRNECASPTRLKTAYYGLWVKGYWMDNSGRNFTKQGLRVRCTDDGLDSGYKPYGKRQTTPWLYYSENPRGRINVEIQYDMFPDAHKSVLMYFR